jgi:hypothetical protein
MNRSCRLPNASRLDAAKMLSVSPRCALTARNSGFHLMDGADDLPDRCGCSSGMGNSHATAPYRSGGLLRAR